ncbi:hypothetical protein ON010_g19057 [Phytophthora cinnamomi]|nr:hypothetical protein ON010_g19057 [Phytophthora cinnamomi]
MGARSDPISSRRPRSRHTCCARKSTNEQRRKDEPPTGSLAVGSSNSDSHRDATAAPRSSDFTRWATGASVRSPT